MQSAKRRLASTSLALNLSYANLNHCLGKKTRAGLSQPWDHHTRNTLLVFRVALVAVVTCIGAKGSGRTAVVCSGLLSHVHAKVDLVLSGARIVKSSVGGVGDGHELVARA